MPSPINATIPIATTREKSMKYIITIIILGLCLFGAFSCGDSSDETEETDDNGDGGDCADVPDLYINQFSVLHYNSIGGAFQIENITICNGGGASVDANHRYGAYLSTSADGSGEFYTVFESGTLAGISAGDCQTFGADTTVPNIPPGYYYIYMFADIDNSIAECNEGNNAARSDDAPYFG